MNKPHMLRTDGFYETRALRIELRNWGVMFHISANALIMQHVRNNSAILQARGRRTRSAVSATGVPVIVLLARFGE